MQENVLVLNIIADRPDKTVYIAGLSDIFSFGNPTDGGKILWNTKIGTVLKVKHGKMK